MHARSPQSPNWLGNPQAFYLRFSTNVKCFVECIANGLRRREEFLYVVEVQVNHPTINLEVILADVQKRIAVLGLSKQ
jgi:hypothetical protein